MILAEKIIYLRKKNGWTQENLAEKLQVSRQAVSKWEGALSVPDLEKILILSKIFGVTTDYLLKDEIEDEEFTDESDQLTKKQVSLVLAHDYLERRKNAAKQIAIATFLCIIAVLPLLLLSAATEIPEISLSPAIAAGLGLILLFILVTIAVIIFIFNSFKNTPYTFIDREPFETEYEVNGMVKEKQKVFRTTYIKYNIIAISLCILSPIPLFVGIITNKEVFLIEMLTISILLAGIGVVLYILAGVQWISMQKLLKEGDYELRNQKRIYIKKTVSRIYWLTFTSLYLGWSFLTKDWKITWIIWPIAGIMFVVILSLCNLFSDRNTDQ